MNYLHGCNGKYSIQVEECFAFPTSLVFLLLFLSWIYVELRGHFSKEYKQVWITISHVFDIAWKLHQFFHIQNFLELLFAKNPGLSFICLPMSDLPSKHYWHNPANICWSSRRLEDVFNKSSAWQFFVFQDVFLKTSCKYVLKTSGRRLAEMSQDVLKTSWKTENCYAEDVLKISWRHVLKTS